MTQVGSHPRGVAGVAAAQPDRPAIVDGDRTVTFGELDALANGLAGRLADGGVGAGDTVGIMMRNRAEWFTVSHAAARLGALVVPISNRFTPAEVDYIAQDSRMRVCVVEDGRQLALEGVSVIDVDEPGNAPLAAAPPTDDFLNTPPARLSYTSGTTGRPKGVQRPAPAPVPVATTSMVATFWGYGPESVEIVCGPLYHTGPGAYSDYALWEGGEVIVQDGFRAEHCLELIERHRVTRAMMVPAHFVRILEADWASFDRSSMRMVIHSAAGCPEPVKWRILEVFPPNTVWELYGATEAMGTVISPGEWLCKPGSVGRPFPGISVRILDDDGRGVAAGHVGTIYVSPFGGTPVTYRGDPDKTAAAQRDGFVTVGDLGHLDADGYLYIADRRTDLIVRGGVNVYPAEVESALAADPDVVDSAVIGLPDDRMGQRVHAIVEIHPGAAPDAEAILGRLASVLADFKRPRTIEFVDELPREANGKILKRRLQTERTHRREGQ